MDAQFWADVINNILGGFGLIFGASVSDNIVTSLQTVTSASTILPNPDLILPFVQAIGFVALLLAIPVSLVNLLAGAFMRRSGYIQRAFIDFAGTYFIAAFGLTIYSIGSWIVNVFSQTVTEIAKNVLGTQGNWYDGILNAWSASGLVASGIDYFIAQIGGFLLVVQSTVLNLAVIPTILLFTMAFILRDRPIGRTFLTLTIVVLLITLFSKAIVASWLAIAAWMFSWVPVAFGIPETVLLAGTLFVAGMITPTILAVFIGGALISRTQIVGGVKGMFGNKEAKDSAQREEDTRNTESAQRRYNTNPSTDPGYDSSASPNMRERAQSMKDRGQQMYTKGREYYDSGIDKAQKTQKTAHTVVMVSSVVESAAPMVAVKFGAVPYVAPIAAGLGVAAAGTKRVATKVESSAAKVVETDARIKAAFTDNG